MSDDQQNVPLRSFRKKELEIDVLFKALVKLKGSDLHLKVDRPPYIRVKGELRTLTAARSTTRRWNGLSFR